VITVQRTLVSRQPVEAVYAYLRDFENAVEWDSGTVACRRTSGDGSVGTTYLNTSRFLGRETELTYTVEDLVPDERIVLVGRNSSVTSQDRIEIVPCPAGSEVVYTAMFQFKGAAEWLVPVLRWPIRRLADGTERSLAQALDRL
jgi:Polyketide cyclase / dehydrase and lipid transport